MKQLKVTITIDIPYRPRCPWGVEPLEVGSIIKHISDEVNENYTSMVKSMGACLEGWEGPGRYHVHFKRTNNTKEIAHPLHQG